ncbi:unnamed protein product [Soboliphyme baturini]|uniref:Uncharacterized protein n=1 Tax=Soboliphyme baturini TaxID=241478 RepID=A0A183IUP5_9BILA|nr:unnamed protein product [Soboliphyme baturini]
MQCLFSTADIADLQEELTTTQLPPQSSFLCPGSSSVVGRRHIDQSVTKATNKPSTTMYVLSLRCSPHVLPLATRPMPRLCTASAAFTTIVDLLSPSVPFSLPSRLPVISVQWCPAPNCCYRRDSARISAHTFTSTQSFVATAARAFGQATAVLTRRTIRYDVTQRVFGRQVPQLPPPVDRKHLLTEHHEPTLDQSINFDVTRRDVPPNVEQAGK